MEEVFAVATPSSGSRGGSCQQVAQRFAVMMVDVEEFQAPVPQKSDPRSTPRSWRRLKAGVEESARHLGSTGESVLRLQRDRGAWSVGGTVRFGRASNFAALCSRTGGWWFPVWKDEVRLQLCALVVVVVLPLPLCGARRPSLRPIFSGSSAPVAAVNPPPSSGLSFGLMGNTVRYDESSTVRSVLSRVPCAVAKVGTVRSTIQPVPWYLLM